jgi:hypothetical protein
LASLSIWEEIQDLKFTIRIFALSIALVGLAAATAFFVNKPSNLGRPSVTASPQQPAIQH